MPEILGNSKDSKNSKELALSEPSTGLLCVVYLVIRLSHIVPADLTTSTEKMP